MNKAGIIIIMIFFTAMLVYGSFSYILGHTEMISASYSCEQHCITIALQIFDEANIILTVVLTLMASVGIVSIPLVITKKHFFTKSWSGPPTSMALTGSVISLD